MRSLSRVVACGVLMCSAGSAPSADAQDFSAPAPPCPSASALAFLEHGLAPPASDLRLEAAGTRWFGLPDLTTRSVAATAAASSLRLALGLSQTGDPALGWMSLGVAVGGAGRRGGAALRAVARREIDPAPIASPLGNGIGAEAGGGAWVVAGERLVVWASAPQLWKRGVEPPLLRPLEIGCEFDQMGVAGWVTHRSPARSRGMAGAHTAGLGLGAKAWRIWLEAKDRPLRGGLGLTARAGPLVVATAVESHPVLGETVRLSIAVSSHGALP